MTILINGQPMEVELTPMTKHPKNNKPVFAVDYDGDITEAWVIRTWAKFLRCTWVINWSDEEVREESDSIIEARFQGWFTMEVVNE